DSKRSVSEENVSAFVSSSHSQLPPLSSSAETSTTPTPRKKKVSRLLKSDDNFMYATFKIKPKGGLTQRKPRRKRKCSVVTQESSMGNVVKKRTSVNLDSSLEVLTKQQTLKTSTLWKFHEQYSTSGLDTTYDDVPQATITSANNSVLHTSSNLHPRYVNADLIDIDAPLKTAPVSTGHRPDTLPASCMTCGQTFYKFYTDPRGSCDSCVRATPRVISSSKLFSLTDSPSASPTVSAPHSFSSPLLSSPITTNVSQASSEISFLLLCPQHLYHQHRQCFRSRPFKHPTGNNLYCSICRTKFAKICDYLSHMRQVHDNEKSSSKPGILYNFKPSKYNTDSLPPLKKPQKRLVRPSKTKKYLSHKTLTCPVEDCPHFFREQKEIGDHFLLKHPDLLLCPFNDCTFTCSTQEDLETHICTGHAGVSNYGRSDKVELGATGVSDTDSLTLSVDDDDTNSLEETTFGAVQHLRTKLPPGVTEASVENHVTTLSQSVSEKPLQCEFCDYRCRQKNALSWHMRKHPEVAGQYRKYN
ncbi:hypothetical protein EGW08_022595, partial [Elysia chlorotica]